MHSIDVDFPENGSWSGGCRWNEEISGLSKLAEVACSNKPSDVGFHVGPPKSKGDDRFRGKNHLVPNIVVGCSNNVEMTFGDCYDLVSSMQILSP